MTFTPERIVITGITQANPCVISVPSTSGLSTGQVVRIHVPKNYGMFQLNQLAASITVLSNTTFSIQYSQIPVASNVNSTNYPAFRIPSSPQFTAEIIPMGAGPTPITKVQWQINNNFCASSLEDATINNSTSPIPF